jgi:hypothetical protein
MIIALVTFVYRSRKEKVFLEVVFGAVVNWEERRRSIKTM